MSASENRTSQTRRSRRRGNRGFWRDLFEAHPTKSNSWKYVGRIGDRLTLTNGEKILPLDMEGRIRQEAEVKDAVIFGVDKTVPGLLVFRANTASNLSDESYINKIWPAIEDANSRAEGFAQINREMIAILLPTVYVPMAAKSSILRAQIYRDLSSIIEEIYSKMENNNEGNLELDIPDQHLVIALVYRPKTAKAIFTHPE
jgi:long-subunit acyl-CoA synthetase (AMP-forming)